MMDMRFSFAWLGKWRLKSDASWTVRSPFGRPDGRS